MLAAHSCICSCAGMPAEAAAGAQRAAASEREASGSRLGGWLPRPAQRPCCRLWQSASTIAVRYEHCTSRGRAEMARRALCAAGPQQPRNENDARIDQAVCDIERHSRSTSLRIGRQSGSARATPHTTPTTMASRATALAVVLLACAVGASGACVCACGGSCAVCRGRGEVQDTPELVSRRQPPAES